MKTAQVFQDKIIIKEMKDEQLNGRRGAIVRVLGCGLCGSDIVKFKHKIVHDGAVLGHEIVAQIVDINSSTNFKIGDKIVTSHHIPCGECNYCKHGNVSMCEHFKKTNIFPGGFSELVYVSEEHLQNVAYIVPENLSEEEISFYEPLNIDWDGNELLLSDILGTENDGVYNILEDEVDKQLLVLALKKLNVREKEIVELRYGLNGKGEKTQKEVADMLGISQSYISRLEKRIIKQLKKEINKMV